ncbi:MAG: hypothetical protein HYZ53_22475 [Planctomycetes bacterium]|nr:hypothetical protein [Planctomycetota bacterium]
MKRGPDAALPGCRGVAAQGGAFYPAGRPPGSRKRDAAAGGNFLLANLPGRP